MRHRAPRFMPSRLTLGPVWLRCSRVSTAKRPKENKAIQRLARPALQLLWGGAAGETTSSGGAEGNSKSARGFASSSKDIGRQAAMGKIIGIDLGTTNSVVAI